MLVWVFQSRLLRRNSDVRHIAHILRLGKTKLRPRYFCRCLHADVLINTSTRIGGAGIHRHLHWSLLTSNWITTGSTRYVYLDRTLANRITFRPFSLTEKSTCIPSPTYCYQRGPRIPRQAELIHLSYPLPRTQTNAEQARIIFFEPEKNAEHTCTIFLGMKKEKEARKKLGSNRVFDEFIFLSSPSTKSNT